MSDGLVWAWIRPPLHCTYDSSDFLTATADFTHRDGKSIEVYGRRSTGKPETAPTATVGVAIKVFQFIGATLGGSIVFLFS